MHSRTLLRLLVALAIPLAVGCDGNDETDAGTGTDAGPMDDGSTGLDSAVPTHTIVDIAVANPDFSMLVAAVTRADLAGALSGPGPFTVFAPTNDAFAASGITMEMIESMPTADLVGILTYHAVAGSVTSGDLEAGPVDTLADLSLIVGLDGAVTINGGNAVTGGANVTIADIAADTG